MPRRKGKAERKSLMPRMNAGCQCPLILSTVALNTWKAASEHKTEERYKTQSAFSIKHKKKDCRHRQSFFL